MTATKKILTAALLLAGSAGCAWANTDRTTPIVARGTEREAIKSMDILDRPDRPLHFYGNTVRRRAQRTTAPSSPILPRLAPAN